MTNKYKETLDKITVSENFEQSTLEYLKDKEKEDMRHIRKLVVAFAACLMVMIGVFAVNYNQTPSDVTFDLRDRIVIDPNGISACVAVNIEGTIVEVAEDGLSFKLDNGQWIMIDDETEYGTSLPTSAAIEDQFLEPTFRVGNSIAGFASEPEGKKIIAYAIYTNWNWDDPIR